MINSLTKPQLILLHGWGGSKNSLAELSSKLEEKYVCHVLEMPGHGTTPSMDFPWEMRNYATWLDKYLKSNMIEEYTLLGHSFGGKIILEAVTSGILKPNEIILIDSNGIKPKNSLKKNIFKFLSTIFNPLLNSDIGQLIKKFVYRFIIREVDYAKTSGMIRESFKIFNEQHYDSKLQNISIPTIIIWGKDDKVTPLWMGKKLNEGIKNSKLFVIDGTHGVPLKSPNEVAEIILNNTK
ncbi:alpha/beta hydrolase [Candidatus Dojkabacteria bacterium]|uniref:Alpha/beta hydrolase n=1 Tax=Candidatus Dojkabacteria bacterium TaxID=2099670 RepID=A0A955RL20_9BACT|nr:alpha/beta hydrolase [Candidatus Dojkabacteria bacterium]